MHLAFKYIKSQKQTFALYNSLIKAGKEAFVSYDPNIGKYFVRFYQ